MGQSFRNTSFSAIIILITQQVLLKRRFIFTKLHNIASQKSCVHIFCCVNFQLLSFMLLMIRS